MSGASPHEIVLRPVVTEHTIRMVDQQNAYTFRVARNSNKIQIRDAVQRLFDVKVERVRTSNYLGKFRRVGRSSGVTANWKKAVVRLSEGDSIDFY